MKYITLETIHDLELSVSREPLKFKAWL